MKHEGFRAPQIWVVAPKIEGYWATMVSKWDDPPVPFILLIVPPSQDRDLGFVTDLDFSWGWDMSRDRRDGNLDIYCYYV